ncbi:hypothetical protein yfred0001_38670 [Yersinia frederiksenii ATCC 33641]|nr:hypothetical protein yfred0001_38670 [Yersinia frederiksenii ATCC 33641]
MASTLMINIMRQQKRHDDEKIADKTLMPGGKNLCDLTKLI